MWETLHASHIFSLKKTFPIESHYWTVTIHLLFCSYPRSNLSVAVKLSGFSYSAWRQIVFYLPLECRTLYFFHWYCSPLLSIMLAIASLHFAEHKACWPSLISHCTGSSQLFVTNVRITSSVILLNWLLCDYLVEAFMKMVVKRISTSVKGKVSL